MIYTHIRFRANKKNYSDDFEVLQKAYVDLDIAKTISLSAKSNMKRRNILLRSARRRNKLDEIQTVRHCIIILNPLLKSNGITFYIYIYSLAIRFVKVYFCG